MFGIGKPKKTETEIVKSLFDRGLDGGETRISTARWLRGDLLRDIATDRTSQLYYSTKIQGQRPNDTGTIFVGSADDGGKVPLGWSDDRHLITVAGSRAGKGVSAILPNLFLYPGSIICMDPKGENATLTAHHRARELGQDVFVLDPYNAAPTVDPKLKARFDPLQGLKVDDPEILEKINVIADAMVVATDDGKDAHWDELSRAMIAALIGHVLTTPSVGFRNLVTMRKLLLKGDKAFQKVLQEELDEEREDLGEDYPRVIANNHDALFEAMRRNEALDGMISGFAQRLADMGTEERGSVLSSTDRHTRFLDGESMSRVLVAPPTERMLDLRRLKTGKRPMTIYLCLPTRYFSTHSRWLRLMVGQVMAAVENQPGVPSGQYRILAILDEFPVLRHMSAIESAIGFMAGYGIILWAILQDLSQLKRDYPATWETFLGNAGMKQFFGNTDHTTLEYISKSLGDTQVVQRVMSVTGASKADREMLRMSAGKTAIDNPDIYESSGMSDQIISTPLLAPAEISSLFRRSSDRQVILTSEYWPILSYREKYYEMEKDGRLKGLAARP